MSDIKRDLRDTETDAKEAWRRADGESLGDKAANLGDRTRNAIEDAGDELHERVDDASREAAYRRGRIEGETDDPDRDRRMGDTGA
jgi:hypothetical protein